MTLKTFCAYAAAILLANTAYIAAAASPTVFYMSNVLAHVVLGAVLWVAALGLLARDGELRRLRSVQLAFVALTVAAAFAVELVRRGNLLEAAMGVDRARRGWSDCHGGPGAARLAPRHARHRRRAAIRRCVSIAAGLLVVVPAAAADVGRAPTRIPTIGSSIHPMAPLSMHEEGGGDRSPFFPSSAQTNVGGTIPSDFFMDSERCASVTRTSTISGRVPRTTSGRSTTSSTGSRSSTCSRWSAPRRANGARVVTITRCSSTAASSGPISEQIDTPEAQAGLACTSCHAIARVDSSMGNGGFTIAYPPLHHLASSRQPVIRAVDRLLTYLDPEPHRRTFMKPFMRLDSAEFCATCHKVHLDLPVNDYRWIRGFNDYDNWQASAVSGQGARSFYYPEKPSTCVDCHMPRVPSRDAGRHADGMVHSHRFPAANTAVPFVNHDAEQLKATTDFLTSGFVSVDIFAASPVDEKAERTPMVRRAGGAPEAMSSFAVGEEAEQNAPVVIREVGELAAPLDRAAPILTPGSTVRLDVVVRTRKIGHFFPGGTVDAFDVWLELIGKDADGRTIFWSGEATDEGRGPVEPGAHFYRSYQLDGHGNPIDKRNAWQTRSLLYVRLIPPGAADVAHYRVRIPKDAKGPLTFTARLQYRKFAHSYTQFAYAGQPRPGQIRQRRRQSLRRSRASRSIPPTFRRTSRAKSRTAFRICRSSPWPRQRARCRSATARRQPCGSRSSTSRAASAGTTGASGCCCRAT